MSEQYKKYFKEFLDETGEEEPSFDDAYGSGWEKCKEAVLEVLKQPLQNLDLSTDQIDSRFLEKIKGL